MSEYVNIYIYTHKELPYKLPCNHLYHPLEVGAALHEKEIVSLRDNTGDNISTWNPVYAEETGLYWLWKNRPQSKYVGVCQYRRQFDVSEERLHKAFDEENFKCLTCKPLIFNNTVWEQFSNLHGEIYLKQIEVIIKAYYPQMFDAFELFLKKSRHLMYSNSYILSSEDFDEYCSFLFDIYNKFLEINGCKTPDDVERMVKKNIEFGLQHSYVGEKRGYNYDIQIPGFLGERLWTVWVQWKYNSSKIGTTSYLLKEKIPY